MRAENEPLPRAPRPLPELDAEQEVDFARYGRTILVRWWAVALAIGAGIVIGYLVSLGGGTVYRSTATVYLGQPLSPSGATQIQGPATNPSTVGQIVKSASVVGEVAAEVGVPAGKLRRGVSTKTVPGSIARSGQTPLVEISVRGPWRRESAEAADRLAAAVVERISGYADVKISSLEKLLASQERELASVERRIEADQAALAAGDLSLGERLTLVNLVGLLEQRRGQLLEEQTQTEQLVTLARDVERGRIVTAASPLEVAARSRRNSTLVGAFTGLIAGALAVLLWEPLLARRRRASR